MSVDDVIVVEPTDRGGWKERRKGERQREGGRDQRWRLAKAGGSGRGGSGGGNGDGLVVDINLARFRVPAAAAAAAIFEGSF